jgi:hypothetical protein
VAVARECVAPLPTLAAFAALKLPKVEAKTIAKIEKYPVNFAFKAENLRLVIVVLFIFLPNC